MSLESSACLLVGRDMWLHSPAVEDLLAHHVAYLAVQPSNTR